MTWLYWLADLSLWEIAAGLAAVLVLTVAGIVAYDRYTFKRDHATWADRHEALRK